MRVCLATEEFPPDVGGVAVSVRRIAGSLAGKGFDVHVFAPALSTDDAGSPVAPKAEGHLTLYRIPSRGKEVEWDFIVNPPYGASENPRQSHSAS